MLGSVYSVYEPLNYSADAMHLFGAIKYDNPDAFYHDRHNGHVQPKFPNEMPASVQKLCAKCLHLNPQKRPSAQGFVESLQQIVHQALY